MHYFLFCFVWFGVVSNSFKVKRTKYNLKFVDFFLSLDTENDTEKQLYMDQFIVGGRIILLFSLL